MLFGREKKSILSGETAVILKTDDDKFTITATGREITIEGKLSFSTLEESRPLAKALGDAFKALQELKPKIESCESLGVDPRQFL